MLHTQRTPGAPIAPASFAVITRTISVANRHPALRFDRQAVVRAIQVLDAQATQIRLPRSALLVGELSIVFMTDAALAELHGQFLDDPSITDVITFEGDPTLGTAGEICVSADAALRQTAPSGRRSLRPARTPPAAAFSAELTLYLVHGWLHLAGYDDLQPAKKRAMRRAEARAMRILRASPVGLPHFSLRNVREKKSSMK